LTIQHDPTHPIKVAEKAEFRRESDGIRQILGIKRGAIDDKERRIVLW
jgi:hypothetical protein